MNRKLRTALAALIAALSVAVMIDAAPAEAAVGPMSASLSISPAGGGFYQVEISGVVPTSSYSEALALHYNVYFGRNRVEYRLWGDDPSWDNLLVGPHPVSSTDARADGLYFYESFKLRGSWLNEDWGCDEVYAGVRLLNSSGSTIQSAQSNTVYGDF